MEPEAPSADLNALNHAWDWFKYHAEQRMTMIRFSMTVIGATAAGVGYLIKENRPFLAVLLSAFGAAAGCCFMRMDQRTADLIKIGETGLKEEQNRLAIQSGNQSINFCLAADQAKEVLSRKFPYSYGENFRVIFGVIIVVYFIVALYEIV
jgi:hypothetical protein